MEGSERLQPKPNGPLPAPESYESASCGPKPERPGLTARGTDIEPLPVTGLAANFSPMPRIAPPPLGRDIDGAATINWSPRLPESRVSVCGADLPTLLFQSLSVIVFF